MLSWWFLMAPDIGVGILLSVVLSLTAAAYIRAVVSKLPTGLARIVVAAPVFTAFAAAPVLLFDRQTNVVAVLLASAFLLWWGNFKVLAFCWGKGLLVETLAGEEHHWLGFLGFTALLSLPIVIKPLSSSCTSLADEGSSQDGNGDQSVNAHNELKANGAYGSVRLDKVHKDANGVNGYSSTPLTNGTAVTKNALANGRSSLVKDPVAQKPPLPKEQQWVTLLKSSLAHGAIFVCLIYLLDLRAYLPRIIIQLVYVLIMYSHMMFSFPLCAVLASAALGVELVGHFDKPWLSSSLADFWGHRWNLTANRVLREAIYFPLKEKLEGVLLCDRPSKLMSGEGPAKAQTVVPALAKLSQARRNKIAKGIAAMMTFFVSGFMHEVIIYYATGEATGEWTAFFTLHGAAFLIESEVVFPLAKHFRLNMPRWTRTLVTLSFFMVTAELLFFPPVVRSGLDRAGLNEFRTLLKSILSF